MKLLLLALLIIILMICFVFGLIKSIIKKAWKLFWFLIGAGFITTLVFWNGLIGLIMLLF